MFTFIEEVKLQMTDLVFTHETRMRNLKRKIITLPLKYFIKKY